MGSGVGRVAYRMPRWDCVVGAWQYGELGVGWWCRWSSYLCMIPLKVGRAEFKKTYIYI